MHKSISVVGLVCVVQLCACVYALHRAAGCVKAGQGPAASQEDRRGSRWICLDLTLPTPLHPPGPPLPTCTSLCRIEGREQSGCVCVWFGGWEVYVMLLVPSRESRKAERERERETLQSFSYRLCVCWTVLTYGPCLHVGTSGLLRSSVVSPKLYSPSATVCSLSQTSTLLVCPVNVLPFLGYKVTTPCEIHWLSGDCFSHSTSYFLAVAAFQW